MVPLVVYDVAIMMARTQITLGNELQRRARRRAGDLGVSFAEYVRRLVARDLVGPETAADVDSIFDLGSSGGSDISRNKDSMIAEALEISIPLKPTPGLSGAPTKSARLAKRPRG